MAGGLNFHSTSMPALENVAVNRVVAISNEYLPVIAPPVVKGISSVKSNNPS
jgi:hypothetical protein